MSKKKAAAYVYSTLAAPMDYTGYRKGGADLPLVDSVVRIEGGANIPDKFMRMPNGAVVTPVNEDELEALKSNQVFQLHMENGFITIRDKEVDGEVAASEMEGRDKSAPLVDADFDEENKPKVNAEVKTNSRKA